MRGNEYQSNQDEQGAGSVDRIQLSHDELHRALTTERRRRLLSYLLDETECSLEHLAMVLTGWDGTERVTEETPIEHNRTVIALDHLDLPLLADIGLVEYDRTEKTVRLEPLSSDVSDVIERSIESVHQP